jgi:uncharacterized 2Fe-2S/4Fe-4S cluster protein (DUF4445 family)
MRTHTLKLWPADLHWEIPEGSSLRDVLFARGVEFPCGGRGRCNGCRVKVLAGVLRVTPEETALLTGAELAEGWRMACRHAMTGDLTLELAQWEMPVLTDHSGSFPFTPQEGLGIAIDLGTTTLAIQLIDLHTGHVLAGTTALNAQARFGADIMSRVEFARQGGAFELRRLIHEQLGHMIVHLVKLAYRPDPVARVVLVGNTVMHHLFAGLDVAPLAAHPFEPEQTGRIECTPSDLGWILPEHTRIDFLPCIGGFVGSDILAGIAAVGLHGSQGLVALLDLGTNGEVVVGNHEHILCTSTAAGPAFEGARIQMGMRAATGAICAVEAQGNELLCRVIGGGTPRGVCGSGLVDAVAVSLARGDIQPDGRMVCGPSLLLQDPVFLYPADVRELQLAKGAIAAGLRMLCAQFGVTPDDLQQVYLAGAFGNYVTRISAHKIGLFKGPLERVVPAGNTALLGAKRALFDPPEGWDALSQMVDHVALNETPEFQDVFAEEMGFPG